MQQGDITQYTNTNFDAHEVNNCKLKADLIKPDVVGAHATALD